MLSPLLSIGIIFKNEIRCLERCLKALQPLREAIPCELVMADTGATDGSRAVAEKYADILFDFPWVNDFAAARNSVMDRCSGKWYMTIDCDEWMDKDVQSIVTFLTTKQDFDFGGVIIRNYDTLALEAGGQYADFLAIRLLRMSTGMRYKGAIHEHWDYEGDFRAVLINGAIFHHDGYVFQDPAKAKEKQKRNMELLKKQLEADPDNLIILTQCIESGENLPEQEDYLRRAIAGVEQKRYRWDLFGAPIYRYAVRFAIAKKLPELEEWIKKAEEEFPDSIFTQVEIAYFAFGNAWNKDDYLEAIRWGEKYLQGVADYEAGRFNRADILASSLNKADSHNRLNVATALASGYLHEKQPEKCLRLMETFDGREMDAKQAGDCIRNICNLHEHFDLDTAPLLLRLWDEINEPVPSQERAAQRRAAFLEVGKGMFERSFIDTEADNEDFFRHAYMAFLPLADKCQLGDAAAMLETTQPQILAEKLLTVESWNEMPIAVLAHALECGMEFPLPQRPMNIEEMDALVSRLAGDKESLISLALQVDRAHCAENIQRLLWVRGLAIGAVRVFEWENSEANAGRGMDIARIFAETEREFLPCCYAQDALREDRICMLPALHRFGWYCAQAFEALDAGDAAGYVRLLREGLALCENVKDMAEFLLNNTPELQRPDPSAELLVLAQNVRILLAQFPPGSPAVKEIKRTEAYQKVAHLVDGVEAVAFGGVKQ